MGYEHMIHTSDNKALVTGDRLAVVTQTQHVLWGTEKQTWAHAHTHTHTPGED